jgi:putative ABC transport system permease protein
MSVIWYKVWRDLWNNKLRTFLVVLATTIGVFAVGLVVGLNGTMTTRLAEDFRASSPPHLDFRTGLFDESLVDTIRSEPGVALAQGEIRARFQWKPDSGTGALSDDWQPGMLIGRDDYEAQFIHLIELMDGHWPAKRTLAVERMSSNTFDLPVGTRILVEVGRREYSLPVEGVVRHPSVPPPQIGDGDATFCTTLETVAWLTDQEQGFSNLKVRLESFSQEAAEATGTRIDDRLESIGVQARQASLGGGGHAPGESGSGTASTWFIVDPDTHWGQELIDTISLILAVLGVLSLGLSGFLIVNTMNATIAQEIWQIGVMKVLGAPAGRVARAYLAAAFIYGLLALLVAVPLAAVATHFLAASLLDLFNVILTDFALVPEAAIVQAVTGIGVPLASALVAVMGGVRITPREAIGSHGLGGKFGRGWLDRIIGRVRRLPRPMVLSLRNTFRRKARVILTLLALAGGGVMFIMTMSVSTSFDSTIDGLLGDFGFDSMITLERPYGTARLIEASESVAGVSRAEVWNRHAAQLALSGGDHLDVGVWGVPPDSQMFSPRIVSGRNLLPSEGNAILLNNSIAVDEGFRVGDQIELSVNGREATWTVVGLVVNVSNGSRDNFVPFDALARASGEIGRGGRVLVTFDEQDPAMRQGLIDDLRETYEARRIEASRVEHASQVRKRGKSTFNVASILMLAMAALAVVVGAIGLMSTMSINVVERAREIGMMRAIGATSRSIAGVFVAESVSVGLLSWALTVPSSYPGARVFSSLVGAQLVDMPLDFAYPVYSLALWLIIIVVVSALAGLWPALRATRISVRQSLAYE